MSLWDGFVHRIRIALWPSRYDRELAEERSFHLELDAMHLRRNADNVNELSALNASRRRFGNLTTHTEDARAMAGLSFRDVFTQDVRFAWRSFVRTPAFTIIAILTLGIGIGANTAIFSAMDALLLRPLPFAEPERLMKVSLVRPATSDTKMMDDMVWSYPKFLVVRNQQQVFTDVALHTDVEVTFRTHDDAERVKGEATESKYFTVLGARPVLGRLFLPDEDQRPDGPKVVMLSTRFWQRKFNADPAIVGHSILIGSTQYTVIGVLPEGFHGLSGTAELWLPLLSDNPGAISQPWGHTYQLIARLKPGVTTAQAKVAVKQLGAIVDRVYPHPVIKNAPFGAIARELDATRVDPAVRNSLYILLGAVGLVLLIACANVANLFLVRASGRAREIAVRLAVGASRARLVRQLLTESLVLSVAGGVVGIAIALVGTHYLASFDAARTLRVRNLTGLGVVRFDGIHVSITALALALTLAVVTGFVFGLVPALQGTNPSLSETLKSAKSNGRNARWGNWNTRNALVSIEIALAFILLAGSGLLLRSLDNLVGIAPGFAVNNLLTLRLNTREGTSRDSMPGFYDRIIERVSALPGVQGVTIQDCPPLNGGCNTTALVRRDRAPVPGGSDPEVGVHWIVNNWTTVAGSRLLRGRAFTSSDRSDAPKVVLVSETAAKRIWPGEDPIGKPVSVLQGGFDKDTATVIGIVNDVRYGTVDEPLNSDVYLPTAQSPRARMMVLVRTAGNPASVTGAVRNALREIAPDLPVYDVRTMEERASDSTAYTKFVAILLTAFGALALALATLGIYGVIAFTVSQRTKEIGIRMALGARVADVTSMVLRQALVVAGAGAVVGAIAALGATRILQSLLYNVTPNDPLTFIAIIGLLIVAVVLASLLPARRAAAIQPTEALRQE